MESTLIPRTARERRRTPSLVDVTPSRAERAAIERDAAQSLLVLGEAGHGKTTVLVLRVAHLVRGARGVRAARGRLRAAVVVPTEGLVRLLEPLFRRVGVDVEVGTFDRWAAAQARRLFRWLPRESELTPANVMRLKRAEAVRLALHELAKRPPGRVDDDYDAPLPLTARRVSRGDLQHLFGDRALMEDVARAAGLPRTCVEDVLERTRVQLGPTAEREHAYVDDRARLRAVDGRAIDDGTATGHADTVDVEDYAVLFELERLRARARGRPPLAPSAFDLIAVDEAQEFSPLELALLGRSLAPGGSFVVSGDADQHTDDTSAFAGWDAVLRELGGASWETVKLEIGYRCPPDVEALARAIRDRAPVPRTEVLTYPDERSMCALLGGEIEALRSRDRRASVVVVCRFAATARRLLPLFRETVPLRLVQDGRFLPRGAVQITTVDEIKGLEFDYVIVPDADAATYPGDAASRRALYVAITRARHQLVLALSKGAKTPLLAST
jgi:DNA helicase-2/ATP-dependent DNA helicase PcrA